MWKRIAARGGRDGRPGYVRVLCCELSRRASVDGIESAETIKAAYRSLMSSGQVASDRWAWCADE
jgi:hypothetical protein